MGAAISGALSSDNNNKKRVESKPPPSPPPPAAAATPAPPTPALPHMFHEIIAAADTEEKNPDPATLEGKVYLFKKEGVPDTEHVYTKKYWVKNNNTNCFMLLPRGMSITWGSDARYWAWKRLDKDKSETEVAELKDVCWLEVDGKMELSHLTPDVVYEVVFEIMMKNVSRGWSPPVNLRLKLPYGAVQERKEHLQDQPREQWLPIVVGEIKPRKGQMGDLSVSLFQFSGEWKKGLVVRGIRITPK